MVEEGESDSPMFNDYTNDCKLIKPKKILLSKTQHGLFVQYLTFECFEIIYLYSDNKHDTYDMPSWWYLEFSKMQLKLYKIQVVLKLISSCLILLKKILYI